MTDQRHATDGHTPDYYVPEPAVPEDHDSFELTDDTVIIYGKNSSRQWIWADGAVERTENR